MSFFCETDLSNNSSGTVTARGCGNKHQPSSSLTINVLFSSKSAQACSLFKPLLSPYWTTAIKAMLLDHILSSQQSYFEPGRSNISCHPNFMRQLLASHFSLAEEASGSTAWEEVMLDLAVTLRTFPIP